MVNVRDRIINEDIISILYKIQSSCNNGKLRTIEDRGDEIRVPCPHHSNGLEKTPAMFIRKEDGLFNCFVCGFSGKNFSRFVGECFNRSEEYGEDWLIANYASDYINQGIILDKINISNNDTEDKYLDDSILEAFESYHPYMTKRHLTKDVIEKYEIKYDTDTQSIVFPVRDINGKLKFLTRRSVEGKKFIIDKNASKSDIYLLNYVRDKKTVFVVEAQLSALVMNGWGYPTIAMLGAGTTEEQMDTLNSTSIRRFILCYDNDSAGWKGVSRFKKFINKDRFVDVVNLPLNKDPNDMSEKEFNDLISLQLGNVFV